MIQDLNEAARSIIDKNEYLSLATVDNEKGVWISVVCYAQDNNWNFYFASRKSSRHCKNISQNASVSFAIYDSRQDWGMGFGLQLEGVVEPVKSIDLAKATSTYFSRKYPYGRITDILAKGLKSLLNNQTYTFYKIVPTKVWMNNPNTDLDERVEIDLIG